MADFFNERFITGKFENADVVWVFWFSLLVLISLIFSIVNPNDSASDVYKSIGYFVLFMIIAAFFASKVKSAKSLPFAFSGISGGDLKVSVALGVGLAFMLVNSKIFQMQSILSPLSIPSLSVTGFGALGAIFMISLYVSEMEESLRASTLQPTMANAAAQFGLGFMMFIAGVIVYFVINIQSFGMILMALSFLAMFKPELAKRIENRKVYLLVATLFTATVFASLHYLVYRADVQLLASAFIFSVIADFVNMYNGNTVASRVAHSVNNGTLAAIAAGLPGAFGLVIGGVHVVIIYVIRRVSTRMRVI